ncbi:MAG: hypothetical protein J5I65_01395 [Aridibacter famidurans]|nr:hypothetical protein [Aridibacter famidurans]
MPTTETAEFYFIAGAFVLILIVCAAATYIFFRQLRRERDRPEANGPESGTADNSGNEEE